MQIETHDILVVYIVPKNDTLKLIIILIILICFIYLNKNTFRLNRRLPDGCSPQCQ